MLHNLPFDIRCFHQAYACGAEPTQVIEEVYRRIDEIDDPGIFLHLVEREAAIDETKKLCLLLFRYRYLTLRKYFA